VGRDTRFKEGGTLVTDAEDARFRAFVEATSQDDRDRVAFARFEEAVEEVSDHAALVNPIDDGREYSREQAYLQSPVWSMLHRVLPRIGLEAVCANTRGLGWAIRYGVIEAGASALDAVADAEDLDDLSNRGFEADRAHSEQIIKQGLG
jgi:hypothetical protein